MACRYGGERQLGTSIATSVNVPTEVLGGTYLWKMISAGVYHSCGVTSTNEVRCWVSWNACCVHLVVCFRAGSVRPALNMLGQCGVHDWMFNIQITSDMSSRAVPPLGLHYTHAQLVRAQHCLFVVQ